MTIGSRNSRAILFAMFVLALVTACGWFGGETMPIEEGITVTDAPAYRATPVAESPAAGICGAWEGDVVTFTIYPDIPDPRCGQALPGQKLRVVNGREEVIRASIGLFAADIEPGGEYLFDEPLGNYLMPGVHVVQISPCCSPELWLKE